MDDWHIGEDQLERFLRLQAEREEARQIVRHLLGGCPRCLSLSARMTAEMNLFGKANGHAGAGQARRHRKILDRVAAFPSLEERRLAVETLRGWGQWASLEALSPQERFAVVEADTQYHSLGLYDRLLEAAAWYTRREPAEAIDIMRLALRVAERLDPAAIAPKHRADLCAQAWGKLANVQRLAADFQGSRRSFNEAWRVLEEEGTNGPVERAHLISLEASYMNDMGEFEMAESSLEEALEIYRQVGDSHQQGRILLQMGDAIGHIDPAQGLSHIHRALDLIDVRKEPRLELCARHDLAWFLCDDGRPEEALAALDRARPIYRRFPDASAQLRLHWLEGRISHGLGNLGDAESIFLQIWDEFRARDLNHDLVLLSIDLAETLAARRESERAAALIEQCYPIFKAWGMHRYALSAWLAFRNAVAESQADDIFRRIRLYYHRHLVRPAAFE